MTDDPETRTETATPRRGVLVATGIGYTAGGLALLLLALGVIPADDETFPMGRLIVGLVAVCIVLGGVVVLARARGAVGFERAMATGLVLLFVTTLNGFFTWALLTGQPPSGVSVQGLPVFLLPASVTRILDRGLLAIAVLIVDVVTLVLWIAVLRGLGRGRP